MADFSLYFPKLLRNEGDYCHNINDRGGETYQGVSRVHNGQWSGWATIDTAKRKLGLTSPVPKPAWVRLNTELAGDAALHASIRQLYRANYWDVLRLDGVHSQSVAEQLADHGINTGSVRPIMMMQYLLKTQFGSQVEVDGKIGPQTIAALNTVSPALFYLYFTEMRQAYYHYRAGNPATSTRNMAKWCAFLGDTLGVKPDQKMQEFLPSWLSRTKAIFKA